MTLYMKVITPPSRWHTRDIHVIYTRQEFGKHRKSVAITNRSETYTRFLHVQGAGLSGGLSLCPGSYHHATCNFTTTPADSHVVTLPDVTMSQSSLCRVTFRDCLADMDDRLCARAALWYVFCQGGPFNIQWTRNVLYLTIWVPITISYFNLQYAYFGSSRLFQDGI